VKQITSLRVAIFIGLAVIVTALLIPGPVAALPVSGYGSGSLAVTSYGSSHGANSLLSTYSLPKTSLISGGYTAISGSGQVASGSVSVSTTGSSALSGLFANAMSNYYTNPPKPITNASPSTFLTPALGTDTSWDAMFNPPVYHGCGCG
jgi:hypothetical protein